MTYYSNEVLNQNCIRAEKQAYWMCRTHGFALLLPQNFPPSFFLTSCLKRQNQTFFDASLLILHILSKVSVRSCKHDVEWQVEPGEGPRGGPQRLGWCCWQLQGEDVVQLQARLGYIWSMTGAFEAWGYSLLLNCEMDPTSSCFGKTWIFSFCAPTIAFAQEQLSPAWSLPWSKMYVHAAGGF